jgi:hypothetical protein
MTKKDLELENKFLKEQLNLINDITKNINGADRTELFKKLCLISCYCSEYEQRFNSIKERNKDHEHCLKER